MTQGFPEQPGYRQEFEGVVARVVANAQEYVIIFPWKRIAEGYNIATRIAFRSRIEQCLVLLILRHAFLP